MSTAAVGEEPGRKSSSSAATTTTTRVTTAASWKIAFADFMTAMMCFFLVMWLINAANEQTKAAVASFTSTRSS